VVVSQLLAAALRAGHRAWIWGSGPAAVWAAHLIAAAFLVDPAPAMYPLEGLAAVQALGIKIITHATLLSCRPQVLDGFLNCIFLNSSTVTTFILALGILGIYRISFAVSLAKALAGILCDITQ